MDDNVRQPLPDLQHVTSQMEHLDLEPRQSHIPRGRGFEGVVSLGNLLLR